MHPGPDLETAILAALGIAGGAAAWTAAGHGSFSETRRLDCTAGRFFVKTGPRTRQPIFDGEAAGLAALAGADAIRVPTVAAVGVTEQHAFLALEWLDLAPGGRDAHLGRGLAALHACTHRSFGWSRDNTIGSTPQENAWSTHWPAFFRDRRLAPQLRRAGIAGAPELVRQGERLLPLVDALLEGHPVRPSLLHGDLWSGNAGRLHDGTPVVFDPAVYFGDSEADLAMTELFGGFDAGFLAAYREARPLDEGYALRRTLYNLYHVLNHFNLFGGSYAGQALAMIARLRSAVR